MMRRVCHARHPCRRRARSLDGRARDADLSDDLLRLQRRRPRRLAVRPGGVRQHLHAHRRARPRRCWSSASPRSKAARRRWPSPRATPRRRSCSTPCWSPATSSSRAASSTAAPSTSSTTPSRSSTGASNWADATDPASFAKAVTPKTKAIFCELIANPGGIVVDLPAIAAIARKAGVPLIVDNTLATPYLCRPKEYGADIVVHSLTKFMGGHGNSIGGVDRRLRHLRLARRQARSTRRWSIPTPATTACGWPRPSATSPSPSPAACMGLRDLGPAISPFNAFLILTGIETLPLRMAKHCENAVAVAK